MQELTQDVASRWVNRENRVIHYQKLYQQNDGKRLWMKVRERTPQHEDDQTYPLTMYTTSYTKPCYKSTNGFSAADPASCA